MKTVLSIIFLVLFFGVFSVTGNCHKHHKKSKHHPRHRHRDHHINDEHSLEDIQKHLSESEESQEITHRRKRPKPKRRRLPESQRVSYEEPRRFGLWNPEHPRLPVEVLPLNELLQDDDHVAHDKLYQYRLKADPSLNRERSKGQEGRRLRGKARKNGTDAKSDEELDGSEGSKDASIQPNTTLGQGPHDNRKHANVDASKQHNTTLGQDHDNRTDVEVDASKQHNTSSEQNLHNNLSSNHSNGNEQLPADQRQPNYGTRPTERSKGQEGRRLRGKARKNGTDAKSDEEIDGSEGSKDASMQPNTTLGQNPHDNRTDVEVNASKQHNNSSGQDPLDNRTDVELDASKQHNTSSEKDPHDNRKHANVNASKQHNTSSEQHPHDNRKHANVDEQLPAYQRQPNYGWRPVERSKGQEGRRLRGKARKNGTDAKSDEEIDGSEGSKNASIQPNTTLGQDPHDNRKHANVDEQLPAYHRQPNGWRPAETEGKYAKEKPHHHHHKSHIPWRPAGTENKRKNYHWRPVKEEEKPRRTHRPKTEIDPWKSVDMLDSSSEESTEDEPHQPYRLRARITLEKPRKSVGEKKAQLDSGANESLEKHRKHHHHLHATELTEDWTFREAPLTPVEVDTFTFATSARGSSSSSSSSEEAKRPDLIDLRGSLYPEPKSRKNQDADDSYSKNSTYSGGSKGSNRYKTKKHHHHKSGKYDLTKLPPILKRPAANNIVNVKRALESNITSNGNSTISVSAGTANVTNGTLSSSKTPGNYSEIQISQQLVRFSNADQMNANYEISFNETTAHTTSRPTNTTSLPVTSKEIVTRKEPDKKEIQQSS